MRFPAARSREAHLLPSGPVRDRGLARAAHPAPRPARGVDDADVGHLLRGAEGAEHEEVELAAAQVDAPVADRRADPVRLLGDRAQARLEALLERVDQRLGLLRDQRLGGAKSAGRADVQGDAGGERDQRAEAGDRDSGEGDAFQSPG